MKSERITARDTRKKRIRKKIRGSAKVPRMSVSRSLNNIYCQLVNDDENKVLLGVSSLSAEIRGKKAKKTEKAKLVGELLAKKAKESGIKKIVFDRSGYPYHGRVRAVAEAARKGGLEF